MIIGIDASQANKNQKTGVEWYCYHLIQELKEIPLKKGDKFILYTPSSLRGRLKEVPSNWESRVLRWPFKYFWHQTRLAWELNFNSLDLFFSPGYFPPFFSFQRSVLVVHDLYSFYHTKETPFFKANKAKIISFLFFKKEVKKIKKIIVPSQFTKKELKRFFLIDDEKIKVIPEGYDKKDFYPNKSKESVNKVLNKYQIIKPYFLFVGRLEKRKNVFNLIKSYRQFRKNYSSKKKPEMVLIGKPGLGYKSIKKQILKTKGVRELGYISREDLSCFYNAALAFVFPSYYEGFGLPVLEAMASGCPVLTSKTSSLPEIGEKACLYCNPKNIKEIAGKMIKLTKDEKLRKWLKNKGLKQSKKFSWQKCAKETSQVLFE